MNHARTIDWRSIRDLHVLILLGDGVVANVGLAPRLAAPEQLEHNNLRLGFCCDCGCICFRGVSRAHLNCGDAIAWP